ncbi:MAG: SPOR domain-containing protein [Candidatus Marinimicrobia bacterium]|nr:SPOR domain-containing protein [Candidatus Neomarinimicrobiota bacterium]MDD5582628.1 SPOR domain-containing protein [Candidatus Neomarinimicrobiota bacterium]
MKKVFWGIVLLMGFMVIFSGCTKKQTGNVGEPIHITIPRDTESITQFQWAFKKKPTASCLDPRDFEPSDYAEAITFVPDVPGIYEVIVVMVDEKGKEIDESFVFDVKLPDIAKKVEEPVAPPVKEAPAEEEKPAEVAEKVVEEAIWEPAPPPTEKQQKAFKPPVRKPETDISAQEAANRIPSDKNRYTVQVSSWTNYKSAEKAMKELQDAGFDAYIQNAYLSHTDKVWYRVRVGNFTSLAEARKVAEQIKQKTSQDTWIDYMRKDY